jgi:CxxC-x17-CxxC domain-containing protein
MAYTDKTLTCADCGNSFIFSAGDQEFHDSKGFTNPPRRCPNCRAARRSEGGGGGGGGFGGGGGGSFQRREMFSATCSSCGKEAQVPFQPRGDRPVYCRDCFRPSSNQGGGGGYGGSRGGGGGGGRGRY